MTLAVVDDELRAARRAMEQCVDDLARVFPAHGSADAFGDDALASAASAWAVSCREEAMAGRKCGGWCCRRPAEHGRSSATKR